MKSHLFVFICSLILIILTDSIFYAQIKRFFKYAWLKNAYLLHSLFFLTILILFHFKSDTLKDSESYLWIGRMIGITFLFYIPKTFYILLYITHLPFNKKFPYISRLLYLLAGYSALAIFIMLLYSITLGRYNYKIESIEVPISQLPKTFDGFRIVHLSDLHLGSYSKNYPGIELLIKKVNALQPDLIVFTGDMVNNFADEIPTWSNSLSHLKAPYGKFAVTGNHDYGDYTRWNSIDDKKKNLQHFMKYMQEMGFHMLNNSNTSLSINHDTLWLAGVENWGKPPFPQYGNLNKALDGIAAQEPVILLSHDPSHWRAEILKTSVSLTLSGHTHAMQTGIQIGSWKWTPSQYLYPECDGLYKEGKKYLYVSRGQGYLGYPGRIGLRPIITCLILKSTE